LAASFGLKRPSTEKRQRHLPELRLAAKQCEKMLTLLPGRDGLARSADRQHAVPATFVVQSIGEKSTEIAVANWLAGRHMAIAEDQERLSSPEPLDLP
jgi:hypothetical protein